MPILVLVTETEFRRAESTFSSTAGFDCRVAPRAEDDLCDEVVRHGVRAVVVGSASYRERLYTTLGPGGLIARFGVGYDNIDRARATDAGVLCTNTPDVLPQWVAELTLTMMGAAARHVLQVATDLQGGRWTPREGVELEGKTLALIGCGAIAQAVARIAAGGFGMRVVGYARTLRQPPPFFAGTTTDFAEAVRGADFVSLHIPASAENANFIDQRRLSQLEPEAWLINTARGSVVDEPALFDALSSGRLAGAGRREGRATSSRASPTTRAAPPGTSGRCQTSSWCRTSAAIPWRPTGAWPCAPSATCNSPTTATWRRWI